MELDHHVSLHSALERAAGGGVAGACATSHVDDNLWLYQWGAQAIRADSAWCASTGAGVTVAVVDTGVDTTHPDLRGSLWVNQAEAVGLEGVDDDGNGFVDDVHGYDFVSDTVGCSSGIPLSAPCGFLGACRQRDICLSAGNGQRRLVDAMRLQGQMVDDHGHGTHVAGIIAGAMNGGGVVGVAPAAKVVSCDATSCGGVAAWASSLPCMSPAAHPLMLQRRHPWQVMALRFIDSDGNAPISQAVFAVLYAIAQGADVISNSWGSRVKSRALEVRKWRRDVPLPGGCVSVGS